MGRRLSMATRRELLDVLRERYASASPADCNSVFHRLPAELGMRGSTASVPRSQSDQLA
jgi:hypothetical protein